MVADGFDVVELMGLMWWRVSVVVAEWVVWRHGFGSAVLIGVVEWQGGDQRGGFIDRCGGVVVSEIRVMVVSSVGSSLSDLLFKPKAHAHEHHHQSHP